MNALPGRSPFLAHVWPGSPSLPSPLVGLVLWIIATQAAVILMNQPPAYWLDPHFVIDRPPFSGLARAGPWAFGAIALLYLVLVGQLLARLKRSAALALAGALAYWHLNGLIIYMDGIGLRPFAQVRSFFDSQLILTGVYWILVVLLVILVYHTVLKAPVFPPADPPVLPDRGRGHLFRLLASGFLAGWLLFMALGLARASNIPATGWRPLVPPVSPSPRFGAAVAYDTQRSQAVLFGGLGKNENGQWVHFSDTWVWDGATWSEVKSNQAPSGRKGHGMAYDEARGVIVLFGGTNQFGIQGDLWEWNGQDWRMLCPVCNPAKRMGHAMYYDPVLKQVVIFGGVGGSPPEWKFYSEFWSFNGEAWSYNSFENQAPAGAGIGAAYDTGRQRSLFFLGGSAGGLWTWQGILWTRPDFDLKPSNLGGTSLAYDPARDQAVLYMGRGPDDVYTSETWIFRQDRWRKLRTDLAPAPRDEAVVFYDPARRSIILFGGKGCCQPFGDTWELVLPGEAP